MIAAMAYIRDESNDQAFVEYWNSASKTARTKLLTQAGCNPNYKFRTWSFIPHDIRVDLVTIIKRQQPLINLPKAPRQVSPQPHWWNKD